MISTIAGDWGPPRRCTIVHGFCSWQLDGAVNAGNRLATYLDRVVLDIEVNGARSPQDQTWLARTLWSKYLVWPV